MNDRPESPPSTRKPPGRRKLAEWRTDYAEDRTALAAERTFAAWMRTGLAGVAVAIAVERLLRIEPGWITKMVAMVVLLAAGACFATGVLRYIAVIRRLEQGTVAAIPVALAGVMAVLGILATAGIAVLVWFS